MHTPEKVLIALRVCFAVLESSVLFYVVVPHLSCQNWPPLWLVAHTSVDVVVFLWLNGRFGRSFSPLTPGRILSRWWKNLATYKHTLIKSRLCGMLGVRARLTVFAFIHSCCMHRVFSLVSLVKMFMIGVHMDGYDGYSSFHRKSCLRDTRRVCCVCVCTHDNPRWFGHVRAYGGGRRCMCCYYSGMIGRLDGWQMIIISFTEQKVIQST
ncbi:unnamed protein product [Ectocarpus fasciculatus]